MKNTIRRIFAWFLKQLLPLIVAYGKKRPYRVIEVNGDLYMERYWLMPRWMLFKDFKVKGPGASVEQFYDRDIRKFAIRLHHIVRPDNDRHLHDHPWNFISIVLDGWYAEIRPVSINPCFGFAGTELMNLKYRNAGSICYRRASDRHAIADVSEGGVWTLVIQWPHIQWWGFYTPQGKIYHKDYNSK